jgi:hypothetical protein
MGFELGSVNKQYNSATETFRYSFNLTHEGDPIFHKTFDGSDSSEVLLASDTFTINNHFFVTGEPLYYNAGPGNSAIGIDHTSTGVGGATTLPQRVFAIKISENKFKVAAAATLAISGNAIGLTTVGVGTTHTFTAEKQNSKCIIALDNVIQSPIYKRIGAATTLSSINNRIIQVNDISLFKNYDLIQINDEIMRIQIVGFNDISNQILVDRAWMGTSTGSHSTGDTVQLVFGDYNINKNIITFADVPFGGIRYTVGFSSSNVNLITTSFTALDDVFTTGSQVLLRSLTPPAPLVSNENYFLIKQSANNYSFASSLDNAIAGIAITLTSAGIGTHNLVYVDVTNGSSFQGRSFIRSNYEGNIVIDDISQNFTGIAKTFTIKSSGVNTTGITSDFGVVLVNNIFQKPEVDYEFLGGTSTGITSIRFTGNSNATVETYSASDVNANKLPRKGLIVSLANTEGYGYQPQYVGTGTAVVSGFGTITVALGYSGSGYRNGPTTYRIHVNGGNPTTGAAGTFTVLNGSIDKIFINTPGVGYTWTNVPIVSFDAPIPYDDIQLISSSTGIGASASIFVGSGLSITSFQLNNIGYGFTVGEQLRIAGIPTVTSIGSTFANSIFTVVETRDDEFAGWVLGKLQVLDDFSSEFDSTQTTFTLTENGIPLSIEKISGSPINLADVLLIFINDVLQKPGESYTFEGGTQITFTEPPVAGSSLQILFYRGTDADIDTTTALDTIKIGDGVTILKNPNQIIPVEQSERIVRAIVSRDTIQTNNYKGQGISQSTSPLRPVVWCKQQEDTFVDGVKISKARSEYAAKIKPTARIIKNISTSDGIFYADGGSLVFSKTEDPNTTSFDIQIIDSDKDNTGFGTTTFIKPVETVSSVSISGDEGIITGIGTTSQGLQFNFFIPLNSPLRDASFGNTLVTGISTGDYFIVSRSNVGNGVTALSQDRSSIVGIATQLLDGIYQVSHISPVGTGLSMRVHVNIETGHGLNFSGLGSGGGNFYGEYSWAKFTSSRSTGLAFTCNPLNGLTGISTSPQIIRTTNLSLDYS